ncbi:hypothetical protein EGW08_013655 [Elysia chlorotica]|uniref:CD109 antigen n=1 Tax=Elysia chlorotica TaxID=188477 RepID=A0A433TAH2_ELYCH|nr:hypothetical protein EGW08_013655 [Elysia chlorotica]
MTTLFSLAVIIFLSIPGGHCGSYLITAPEKLHPGSSYDVSIDILNTTDVNVEVELQSWVYNYTIRDYIVTTIDSRSDTFSQGAPGSFSFLLNETDRCPNCRLKVRGQGNLQFEHVHRLSISDDIVVVLVQTDKAIYKPGQIVRFRIIAVYPSLQTYQGDLSYTIKDPNGNRVKLEPKQTLGPFGVIEGEFELSEQPTFGYWSINVDIQDTGDTQTQTFTVADYELPRFEITVELPPFGLESDISLNGKVKAKYTFGEDVKGLVELHVGPDTEPDRCGKSPKTTQISFNIQATTPDGKSPPTGGDQILSVYTTIRYELFLPDQSFYTTSLFEGSYPAPGQNLTLPPSGVVPVSIDIPDNATSIDIKATFRGVSRMKAVSKTWSQSNNFLRLAIEDSNIKAGDMVMVNVEGTEPLTSIKYEVIARGTSVWSESVNGNNSKSLKFELPVTSAMAPVAHLLAYYSRDGSEIVADSVAFQVAGLFENEVSVSFSRNESEPAQQVEVLLSADPMSLVSVLAVDQSVLLLKSGNDINEEKVSKAVSAFDGDSDKPSSPDYALSYSSANVKDVFEKTGLVVLTDVVMEEPIIYRGYSYDAHYEVDMEVSMTGPLNLQSGPPRPMGRKQMRKPQGKLAQVERIRNAFPETWLWTTADVGANGTATLSTTVPDTITSWVVSAFATNSQSGLGVAPTTPTLKVFRPFFISLNYPSTVIKGEHVVVQATIFNYLPSDLTVTVQLKGNSNFQNIAINPDGSETLTSGNTDTVIQVISNEQGVVYFPIKTTQIGLVEVEVTAQSSLAADGVRRFMEVQSEGVPVSYVSLCSIKLGQNGQNETYTQTINFTLPASAVPGSEKAKVKVSKYLLDSTLDGLSNLLELPTGCGEQSLAKMASNVYIAKYLKSVGLLTGSLEREIKHNLATGYQRQLTYQRYDNSYSAFGNNDPVGSTWLTASVARVLAEAMEFTYIDEAVVRDAVKWLTDRQARDGSFASFGKVLDPNTQVARTGEGLTAYVTLTILTVLRMPYLPKLNDREIEQLLNSSRRAVQHLEEKILANAVTDRLSLSMVSFALARAGSSKAQMALQQLDALATVDGVLTYWEEPTSTTGRGSIIGRPGASSFIIWHPPVVQARPVNIMITSYAILAKVYFGAPHLAFGSVRWLIAQRNPTGGFSSTQDTMAAIEALAHFSASVNHPDSDIDISVTANNGAGEANFTFVSDNDRNLQVQELAALPTSTEITATGVGFSLVEMVYSFNVDDELSTPSFDVSTVLLDDDIDSFNLMICTKWLWDRETGMVVQEIGIPSGFNPDLSTLGTVAGLQRSERRGNTIAVYFDKISKSSLCYSLVMSRTAKIAQSQRNYVRTFDYYQPSDQSTVFYQPRKLAESTVCDVCDRCCP